MVAFLRRGMVAADAASIGNGGNRGLWSVKNGSGWVASDDSFTEVPVLNTQINALKAVDNTKHTSW